MSRYATRWVITLLAAVIAGVLFGFVIVPIGQTASDGVRSWLAPACGIAGGIIVIAILAAGQRWAKKARPRDD